MKKLLPLILLLLSVMQSFSRSLDEIRRSGVVRVAFTKSGLRTINYQFAKEFANFLNCELQIVQISWNEIFSLNGVIPDDYMTNDSIAYTPDALKKADFICGTTYIYPWREKFFDFGGNMEVSDLLIVRDSRQQKSAIEHFFVPETLKEKQQKLKVKNYGNLKGLRIALLENSSYESNMQKIIEAVDGDVEIVKTKSEEESQELARLGKVDGFVTVSYVGLQFVKENPKFRLAFPIAHPNHVAWAIEKGNRTLRNEIDAFFDMMKGTGVMDKLFAEKFGVNYSSYNEIINSYSNANSNKTSNYRDLDEILESKKLIVSLRDREMVYHPYGQKQFNHYLAGEFAKYLGCDLEIRIVPSLSSYFEDDNGEIVKDSAYTPTTFNSIDIACDMLSPVDWRLNKIDIVDVLPTANIVVAKKGVDIKGIKDLKQYRGVTSKGSSYEEDLIENNITNYYYKEANEFFSEIIKGNADYSIVNFDIYSLPKYSDLEAKFVIGEIYSVGWGIKKNQPKLRQKILEFLESSSLLGILNDAFMGQTSIPYKAAQNHLTAMYQTYQSGYFPFVFYGSDQGLPQEDILCIFQDSDGYMWFGTHSGAIKFNGRTMVTFNEKTGMKSNIVFDIAQDKKKRLYLATLNGVSCIERNGKITNYFENIPIKHIFIDESNNKYLYGDKGLYYLSYNNQESQMSLKIPALPTLINALSQNKSGRNTYIASPDGFYILDNEKQLKKITDKNCYDVFVDEDGLVWLSAFDGLYTGNYSQFMRGNIDSLKINNKVSIPETSRIHTIKQNKDGSIFLLSDFEAYQIFSLSQTAIKYDQSIGLKNLKLLSFIEDKEDNYWFGFSGGIQKLTNRSLRNLYPEVIDSYLNNIEEDSLGRIWMAFNNKVFYYHQDLVNFSKNLDGEGVPYVVGNMKDGNIFIADSKGCAVFDCKTLTKIRELKFKNKIYNLKGVYIADDNQIFLLSGIEGLVYRIPDLDAQPIPVGNACTSLISQIVNFQGMTIGGNNTGLVKFNGLTFEEIMSSPSAVLGLAAIGDKLWTGLEDGLGYYTSNGEFRKLDIPTLPDGSINSIRLSRDKEHLWLGTNKGFCYYNIRDNKVEFTVNSNDGLTGNEIVTNGLLLNGKGVLYVATFHGVSVFDLKKESSSKTVPQCRMENIYLNGNKIDGTKNVYSSNENNFLFELAGLSFKDEAAITYEFYMKGLDNDYVASSGKEHRASYQNLPPGNYDFIYRAKGKDGIWCHSNSYKFEILKPFYRKWWFIAVMVLGTLAVIVSTMKVREAQLKRQNEHLEKLVSERTSEIQKQKEAIELKNAELEVQREEILTQRDAIEEQNAALEMQKTEILSQKDELEVQKNIAMQQRDEIAHHQKEIMDSIYYAKRIQNAIMPKEDTISKILPEHFVLFRPRDIVSGDFYYFKHINNYAVIVAADCTGHGVPGAFMSMLGSAYLNEIVVNNQDGLNTGHVLDLLRESIIESLQQTGKVDEAKDGMDIAICILDLDTKKVQYSGAFNPMFLVREGELEEYRADRMPIGIHDYVDVGFTSYDIDVQKDDIIYIFSDGYASQFGGKMGKKFMSSRMKKLLLEISGEPMDEQKKILNEKIEAWMGTQYDQVDDILVIGFKIS
ncbi:MAG: transporter substrate-binding domain-containing protein [Bacteroidales bacterium]|nr:transporter substrate-binding domain-containing protein [Bacteroidales bacterium]